MARERQSRNHTLTKTHRLTRRVNTLILGVLLFPVRSPEKTVKTGTLTSFSPHAHDLKYRASASKSRSKRREGREWPLWIFLPASCRAEVGWLIRSGEDSACAVCAIGRQSVPLKIFCGVRMSQLASGAKPLHFPAYLCCRYGSSRFLRGLGLRARGMHQPI